MTTLEAAYHGSLIADAFAMPVHWYYNREALDCDYPRLNRYHAPLPHHPDSILWRSDYTPPNEKGEILHDQASFWGQRNIHYHQNLKAGENTVNFKLARALYEQVSQNGSYDPHRLGGAIYRADAHPSLASRHLPRGIPPGLLHPLRSGQKHPQMRHL